jgi:hypothetical protein
VFSISKQAVFKATSFSARRRRHESKAGKSDETISNPFLTPTCGE